MEEKHRNYRRFRTSSRRLIKYFTGNRWQERSGGSQGRSERRTAGEQRGRERETEKEVGEADELSLRWKL